MGVAAISWSTEPVRCRLSFIMGIEVFHADVSKLSDTPVMTVLR
jgi:hypothetical protein